MAAEMGLDVTESAPPRVYAKGRRFIVEEEWCAPIPIPYRRLGRGLASDSRRGGRRCDPGRAGEGRAERWDQVGRGRYDRAGARCGWMPMAIPIGSSRVRSNNPARARWRRGLRWGYYGPSDAGWRPFGPIM